MAISSWFSTFLNGYGTVLFRYVLRCFCLDSFMGPPQIQVNSSMAASSSSVHSTPPSSSSSPYQSRKHDVFLSFRGTDTRNTFVDHLYLTLKHKGIETYKDDKTLPRGETIGPTLLKAIEESQIAVIVFSENYADSSWCLQELVHIMKCKDERGLIVMPIFYHIDPSELRNQKKKYGEALAKHESKKKNVKPWRKALEMAGNLSGFVPNGPETTFIKKIVDAISSRLCLAISSDDEDFIGIKARLQDLKLKMEMESDGVVIVGIWGIGGGGKTTLANALYDNISREFDGSCFLEDVREESSKYGLEELQRKILSIVLKQQREEVVGDVRSLIKRRLQRKKVLMVLDDVDHADQLEKLVVSNAWFGKGSRIIITTRDEHLLNLKARKVNVIYNINLLNGEEAIKLFYKHAPQEDKPIEEYEILSKDVVSYAAGLPLAIKVLGSFLCDKDMSEWKSALARLKEIPDSDIVEKLKISYDGLKSKEKEMFLDIACFFRGCKKDKAMEIFDACGYYPIIGVKALIQKALITVSEEGIFGMHDLIQEMGHYIVRGENLKNPELHSRVWQKEDVVEICERMDTTKENDIIEALQVSRVYGDALASLPEVVGNMKKLRWISWTHYPATSLFPREFQPMELCYLKLKWSLVKQLWKGYKYLPNLKVLHLSRCRLLVRTPDFDGLPCLERLMLVHCKSLKEIHPSIGYHQRLIFLDMELCTSLKLFPPIIRMKKLETLLLTRCFELCKFPEIQTSMDNLVKLSLTTTGIKVVPSSVGQYCTNLVSLNLRNCDHLHSIEGNFHLLKHLKGLYLDGCEELKNIPKEGLFDVECHLHVLSLSWAFRRINLHQLLGVSDCLRRLSLARCSLVDGDISYLFLEELPNLEALDLSWNKFSRLHSSLSQLTCLKYLDLSHCKKLVELPDLPPSIAILIAFGCDSLKIVEDFPSTHLKWLWKVSLSARNCNALRVLESMLLQGNAIEDYFISIHFDDDNGIPMRGCKLGTFTLQLPWNWCDEFCGFLVYIDYCYHEEEILITIDDDVLGRENDDDDEEEETKSVHDIWYISFGSLRDTSWWKSTHTTISFSLDNDIYFEVELVPRRSLGDDSIERGKDITYRSEFWDEESPNKKTFGIAYDSRSSIEILWHHSYGPKMFEDSTDGDSDEYEEIEGQEGDSDEYEEIEGQEGDSDESEEIKGQEGDSSDF